MFTTQFLDVRILPCLDGSSAGWTQSDTKIYRKRDGRGTPPRAAVPPSEIDSGLASLMMLARFFGVPASADQLRHQFAESGRPVGEAEILLAAKHHARQTFTRFFRQTGWGIVCPVPALSGQVSVRGAVVAT